jgi:diguanylate cyclase (GGDEF)-like protein
LDQSLVIDVLVVAMVVAIAIPLIVLAVGALLGRGSSRGESVQSPGDQRAAMPVQAWERSSSTGVPPILVSEAGGPLSPAASTAAPTSATSAPAVATTIDRAPADSRPPSGAPWLSTPPSNASSPARPTIHPFDCGDGEPEARDGFDDEMLVDPATGLASGRVWDELLRHEEDRLARYRRPVTLVVADLDGLSSLAARLGPGAADQLIPRVAATLEAIMRNARSTDVLMRTGHARFVALLPETDEVAAVNYVERVRTECDTWLQTSGLAVRLAVGWAQPIAGGSLADALHLAHDRMNADRRLP